MSARVVSLIASATEFVHALGCGDRLVGRSHECDFPESVKLLPVCTAPKFEVGGSSVEIHEAVTAFFAKAGTSCHSEPRRGEESASRRSFGLRPQDDISNPLNDALSVYRVHTDILMELKPDLIITQSQCEVCAVSLKEVERAVSQFVVSRPQIVSLEPDTLSDVWKNIGRVAEALGVLGRGTELIKCLSLRMAEISAKAQNLTNRPTIAYLEWIEPPMTGGNWMPELIDLAGARNLFGIAGKHSPWLKWEELVAQNPDVIIIAPCGFGIERSRADLHFLAGRAEWRELKAVRTGRVFIADGNHYFNRPGPRLVETLEILAEIFHPEAFHFGHEGTGWERLK